RRHEVAAVRLVFAFHLPHIPEPVRSWPEGVRLTEEGVLRICWYHELLTAVAARSGWGDPAGLPRPCATPEEPLLGVGQGETAWGLPLAMLLVWRPDGIDAGVGAVTTFALATPEESDGRLCGAWRPAFPVTAAEGVVEPGAAGGGELPLRLYDNSPA